MPNVLQNELSQSADLVAPRLLGCELVAWRNGQELRGRIVETEAYDQHDAASHSFKGKTPRTSVMFGQAGHLYVYFTYGMHYCCNVVTGPVGNGSAVLIRAIEPLSGQATMEARRGRTGFELTNGPAKICQAFGIDRRLNGHDLQQPPMQLILRPPVETVDVVQTTRIGISQAKEKLWRFYLLGNEYVSKK